MQDDKVFLLPDLNSRIKMLIDKYSKGSVKAFAETLPNVSQQKLNRIFIVDKRTNKIPSVPDDVIIAIANKYPEINADWLITGKGEMLNNNQHIGDISNSTVVGANINGSWNSINHNNFHEMIELQKGYQDLLRKKDEHISELIGVINRITNFTNGK